MDRTKITPQELKRFVAGSVRRTPYTPKALKDAMYALGAKPSLVHDRTMSKQEFYRFLKGLKAKAKEMPRLIRNMPLRATKEKIYQNLKEQSAAAEFTGSDVPLASDKLPAAMQARLFVDFYGRATGKPEQVKALLQKLNMPYGSAAPRPGVLDPTLSKAQMLRVLKALRQEGKLTTPNIGERIGQSSRRREVYIKEGFGDKKRYTAAELEDLPEGVRRSIGRPAAGSALTAGGVQRSSSIGRAAREQTDEDEAEGKTHATTGSELARHDKPYDPKTSITRSRGGRPAGPPLDLPIGE